MITETTYGMTPAAKYLYRELMRPGNHVYIKSVTRRIVSTNSAVNDLVNAHVSGNLKSETLANTLRLMRNDISSKQYISIIDQLCQNLQIGSIKRAIRLSTVNGKIERVMNSPEKKSSEFIEDNEVVDFYMLDKTNNVEYLAGFKYKDSGLMSTVRHLAIVDVTPEELMEKSERRNKRLNRGNYA